MGSLVNPEMQRGEYVPIYIKSQHQLSKDLPWHPNPYIIYLKKNFNEILNKNSVLPSLQPY